MRGQVLTARRVLARADAIQHARRSLAASDLGGDREDAQHLEDGTVVMGRESYHVPIVRKFRGEEGRVLVGSFVSIDRGVECHPGGLHRTERVSHYGLRAMLDLPGSKDDFPHGHGDIHVGHDAWLAEGVIVMSGVTIGPGAVVATRSVVTRDVPPYAIVAGVPAKQTGRRFGDEQIAALLRIAWWDWPLQAIKERVDLLSSPDVDAFIAAYDHAAP